MAVAMSYADSLKEVTLWSPTLHPGHKGFHVLIYQFMTDTLLENALITVREQSENWNEKHLPFAKLLQFILFLLCILVEVQNLAEKGIPRNAAEVLTFRITGKHRITKAGEDH